MIKKIIKNILPKEFSKKIPLAIWEFKNKLRHFFSRRKSFASFFYSFLSKEFNREQYAVIQGIKEKREQKVDQYLLRRNVHRIEKGLAMRPRRPIFGEGFIEDTLHEFNKLSISNNEEYIWFRDVLGEYFNVTGDSPIITPLRKNFQDKFSNNDLTNIKPYSRKNAVFSDVTYDQILSLSQQRRSVRWYKDIKVPRDLIEKALKVGLNAPSACNRQPFEFLVYDDPKKIKKIASIPMGTVGFHQQFPMVIVVVGDLSAYDNERDRHVIYIDGSLSAMGFILALETLGLSSCMINWPDIEPLELNMNNELNLPVYKRPLFLISVGYADQEGIIPYSMKKDINETVTYNK
ncbi:Nitroreductase [Algibacter lectus]|uniref:nitroreductase family protein n=1 Tax=Algibacter lectus TaxID=221126 RepID=UPI0008EEF521|nr:nitroreductase family protein [Algibacter lectus]SFC34997.1 Nitroreductase [Algibacter lectus]